MNRTFKLFGRFSSPIEESISNSPDERLGNNLGMAMVNIARAWVDGNSILEVDSSVLQASPFWRKFSERYYVDHDLREQLSELDLSVLSDWANAWFPVSEKHLAFWELMVPYITRTVFPIYEELATEKQVVDMPVLHYRAGDVPFVRHQHYRLAYYRFFDDCLDRFSRPGKILVLTSTAALTSDPQKATASRAYLADVIAYLESRGVECTVMDGRSVFDDLHAMTRASHLATSVFSSFSFLAGLAKPAGRYYSGRSESISYQPSWMHDMPPLPHEEIEDYFDTGEVIRKLREGP